MSFFDKLVKQVQQQLDQLQQGGQGQPQGPFQQGGPPPAQTGWQPQQPEEPQLDTAGAPPFSAPAVARQRFTARRGLTRDVSSAEVSYREWPGRDWGYPHLGTAIRQMVFRIPADAGGGALELQLTLAPFTAPGSYHLPSFGNEVQLSETDPSGGGCGSGAA